MRFLAVMMGFLLFMFSGTFWLLFTQSGNDTVRPYLEKEMSKKLQKEVTLHSFTFKTNYVDIKALIDNTSTVTLNGPINLLDKWFDLSYMVDAKNLETPVVLIRDQLQLEGNAKGFLQDFTLGGRGLAFKSKVRFGARVKEGKVLEVELDAKGVQIGEMLELIGKPRYTTGIVDVVVRGKEGASGLAGKADAKIHIGRLNEELIKRDFNIALPINTTYKGMITSVVDKETITAKSDIFTTLALLKTNETKIDLKTKSLNSDYEVLIANLTDLEPLIGKKLYGSVRVTGNIKKEEGTQAVDAHTQFLGGQIDALLVDTKAEVTYKDVQIRDLFSLVGEPAVAFGKINGVATFDDIRPLMRKGKIILKVDEGELVGEQMRALSDLKFPQVTTFNAVSDINVEKNIATFEGKIASSLANISSFDGTYDLDTNHLLSDYVLNVATLEKLDFMTKKKLYGPLEAKGSIERKETFVKATAVSGVLDGNTTVVFENDVLHVNADAFAFKRLSELVAVPYVFESSGVLVADYNLTSKRGEFSASMAEGKLLQSELTNLVKSLSGFDMTQELYRDSVLKGNINQDSVDYNVSMQGEKSSLHVTPGTYDIKSSQIRAEFDLNIEERDFNGVIKGDIKQPTVNLKGSEYLKKKLEHEIDKHVPENAKGILKDILKLF